ncbi:MAG: hypothetical protein M3131_03105 [Actinomycetota bacterium]|nr:hypothetical protein [Actinomycetota bacterium]
MPPQTLETAGKVAETFAEREAGAALLSPRRGRLGDDAPHPRAASPS